MSLETLKAKHSGNITEFQKDQTTLRFENLERVFEELNNVDKEVESRVTNLEKSYYRLYSMFTAEKGGAPMDRGMTYFPAGDSIPSRSSADLMNGNVYILGVGSDKRPFRFTKNSFGRALKRGEVFDGVTVDTQLRRDEVLPNDFFYAEL